MSKSGQPKVPASAGKASEDNSLAAKAKLLEGVDFIENEGDVEAVESAVVKIQSTFRGKKIRSKLGAKQAGAPAESAAKGALSENKNNSNLISSSTTTQSAGNKQQEDSLSKKLATMQVNDKTPTQTTTSGSGSTTTSTSTRAGDKHSTTSPNLPEDVAATKIQAGFKGYKTRKELAEEGKLAGSGQGQSEHHEAAK